ncbi:MAG: SRPBCC family protein [Solirubrobacteraceae bacterium]
MPDRIERHLDLPCAASELWRAITEADVLAGWLADEVALELLPGGEAWFRDAGAIRTGWVEEVQPPEPDANGGYGEGRLAFWWGAEDEAASRVELSLLPLPGGGTRLRVAETRPLEVIDLVGIPLPGSAGRSLGPALAAAGR